MSALVSIRNVVKGYVRGKQRVEVLHALDLEVEAGEFLALMGPSGSGKTTLLNLIGGLDRPDRGEITVAGRADRPAVVGPAREVARAARRLHLPVLQPAAGAHGRAQRRGAAAAHEARRARSASATCSAALELVGLADRAKHKPAELSGGQQQRVAIARALVADPTLLVCDEPTGDLDRETSESILELLQLLNRKQGKTIVMVTHDPRAADHASRRLYVDKGSLVRRPRSEPRHEVLAARLGGPVAQAGPHDPHAAIASSSRSCCSASCTASPPAIDGHHQRNERHAAANP